MRYTMDTKLLVFLTLAATATAGPISSQNIDKCSTRCTESSQYRYSTGTTYIYDYSVETATDMAGASEHTARLTLQTSGNIHVLSPCEFSLQFINTRLFHSDENGNMKTADRHSQFSSLLEAQPLRFSFQDGKIEHVCASVNEDAWTLNMKRGFLSSFQNSMDDVRQSQNVTETDVTGTCKTEYTVVKNGYYTTTLKKSKDILSCTNRHNFETMIQTAPYLILSDIQSLPLMKTAHECEQSIQVGGILKSTVCSESHVYRPFANGMSGGSTKVTQKLNHKENKRGISSKAGPVKSRDTLVFDHIATQPTKEQARHSVEQKLGAICDSTVYDIRPESPRLFTDLVMAMKSMDAGDMADIYRLLKTMTMCPKNTRAYKFFLDALPMTNTQSSVRVMSKLIANSDVEGLQAKAWLTSLAFIPQPTSEMVLEMKALIDNKKVRDDALLPVTSLVNNYCKRQASCDQNDAVLSIMASLERVIGYRCHASGKNFDEILLTLRAIGNAGHVTKAAKMLNKCMTVISNPIEIRIAAIEAFRRMPCTAEDKNLWDLFMDRSLDSELRISAYMALMHCPNDEMLGKIASILFDEDNEQVGAFVYSHLTNLRESSNPHKQDVARMIDTLALEKEFNLSPLKFSRNYEMSTLINKFNLGFTAESSLIWSSSDQLPRSMAGNLTVELFGQSINIFDFGGRLEGLEYLLRNVFGPYVNSDEKAEKQVDLDKVQGSIYGRIFGNEMLFVHSKTAKSPFGKMPFKWLNVLIKLAKKQEFAFTQNVQFIDACMVIPTSAGLPVQIHVNGTAIVDLSVSGKMDLRKVGASPRSMDVDGEVRPRAALEITGTMAVDAFVTKTGLRMRNTMHSSTSMKGRIQLNRGQQLNIEFDTPEDKIEIFGARSQFYILHNDIEQEQEMIKENRKEFKKCSGDTFATIAGLEFCEELSFPNASHKSDGPYFPLTGPTSFSVSLFKRDTHSGYKLFAKRIENKKASIAQFSVNTPGSKVNRAVTVDLTLNYAKQSMEVNMFSPWKKTEMKGNLINQNGMKSVSGRLVIDEVNVYTLTSEVKTVQSKKKIQFSPMIEIKRPGEDNVQLFGLVAMEHPYKTMNIDMTLTGIRKMPYILKSKIMNTKKEKSLTASFSNDGKKTYSIEASNKMSIMSKKAIIASLQSKLNINTPTKQLISISGKGDYREDKSLKMDTTIAIHRILKRPASFKVSLVKNAKKKGSRYDLDAFLKSTKLNARIDSNMLIKPNGIVSTRTTFDYHIPQVNKNKIIFTGKFNDRSTKNFKKYSVRGILDVKKNPEYNMGLVLGLDHKKKHSEVEVDLKYGPNPKDKTKKIYFLTSLTKRIANMKNAIVSYKIKAQAPEHKVDISLGGKHTHTPKMMDSNVQLKYGKNKAINAGLTLKDQSTKLTKLNGKMNVEWPGKQYALNTQLIQKSAKQYSHMLNIKGNDGTKHSMVTIYKMPKLASHDFTTDLNLHGLKEITLHGLTTLNWRNFAASGKVTSGKDTYGIVTATKFSKAPNAKINVELIHPARRMTLDINGGKMKNKYEGSVATSWDADRKESQVVLDGAYVHKSHKGAVSVVGNLNFRSPFNKFENLLTSFKYGGDKSQHNIDGKFSWGGNEKQIVSSMNIKKDLSLKNIDITVELKTPFQGFRSAEISVDHNLADSLDTVLKGSLDKENMKIVLQGQDNSDNTKTDIKGNLALRSTLKNAKSITAAFSHSVNGGKLLSSADMTHNGQKYECDINVAHTGSGWDYKNNGDITIKVPKRKVTTKWAHRNSDKAMKCTLVSSWGKKSLTVDMSGSHELTDLRKLNADLKIKSPWMAARNIEMSLDHKHGNGMIKSHAFLNQNGKTKVLSKVNFKGDKDAAGLDFELKTPLHDDVDGKLNARYETYPMTSSAELSWAPKQKATIEGSLNLAALNNAEINVKLTTPSRNYRNILFKASNKMENDETISHMLLDYGMRQNFDLESRMAYNDLKKFVRVKLMSPFENIKSLESGLSFDGHAYNFESRADFELLPTLGKFDTVVNWQYENEKEMNGKVRLNTPFKDYQYFELSTSSELKSDTVQSKAQLEFYPRKIYSLDSTYTRFNVPFLFEATIKSPHPEYNNLGVSIKHNHGDSFISSQGEIKYQPDASIEGDLKADWSSGIDGSLVVTTPFKDFERNQVSLRHKGRNGSFSTHGEGFIASKKVIVDASVKTGLVTSGTFTFKSPISGMKNIKATLKKRGNIDNLKGGIVFIINKEKTQANFNHRLTKSSMKSGLSISTPHTNTIKLSLDHNGLLDSFSNKISFNYGRKVDIDTMASFRLRESNNNMNGNAILKYKLGKGRNTAKLAFKKSGPMEDMSFSGTASHNKDDISIGGSLKTLGEIDGSLTIKTPFENFKATGMTLSHKGNLNYFQSNANINYMDDKSIYGIVKFSNRDQKRIRFSTQLNTPFNNLKSSSFEFNNEINEMSNQIDGSIVLTTTLNKFGTGNIVYTKSGDLNNLMIDTSVARNGKDMAALKMTNKFQVYELHSKFNMKSIATPTVIFTIDHTGDFFSFNTKTEATIGKNTVSGKANMKRGYQSFDADGLVLYRFANRAEKKCSVNVHTDGHWERCNFRASGTLNDNEVKLSASRQGAIQDVTVTGMASYNGQSIDINGSWKNEASIDGNIDIQTPFDKFNNIGLALSHSGDASKFSSSATFNYMDNKKIVGTMDVTAYSIEDIQFNTHLSTPFEDFKYVDFKFINAYEGVSTDVSGDIGISTSVAGFGTKSVRYSKTGNLNNLKMEVVSINNGIEASSWKISNDYYGKELHTLLVFKIVSLPEVLFSVDHEGDMNNMKTIAKGKFGKNDIITGEATYNVKGNVRDGEAKFMYNIAKLGRKQGSLKMHKEGENNDVTVEVTATVGNKISEFNGNFRNTDELSVSMTLNTPLENFKDIGMSFRHNGNLDRFNCNGKIELMDDKIVTGKIDFYRYELSRIETIIEMTTPLKGFEFTKYEYRHEGDESSFKCSSTLEYGDSKKIAYDLTAEGSPNPDFKLTMITPSNTISSSGSLEYTWPKYAIKGRFDDENSRVVTIDGSLDATNDIIGSFNLNTPLEHFTDIGFGFSHNSQKKGFESRGQITYMDGKTVSCKADVSLTKKGKSDMAIELRTPFAGFEFTSFEQMFIVYRKFMKSATKLVYNNDKTIVYEMYKAITPKQEFTISLKTPFENYEELMAYMSLDNSGPKYGLNSKIIAGNGNNYGFTGLFDVSSDISGALKIETPHESFTDIGMDFLHSGNAEKFGTEGKVTYMDGKEITGKVSFYRYMWRRIVASAELSTPFMGMENTKVEMNFEDKSNSIGTGAALEYGAGKKLNGDLKLTHSPSYDIMFTLNIPFIHYKQVRAMGSLDLTAPTYEVAYLLDHGNNKIYSSTGKINFYSFNNIEASLQVNTPETDDDYAKAEYKHMFDASEIDIFLSVPYKNSQKMSAGIKSSMTPNFDASVSVKTPFYGFEDIQCSAAFIKSYNRYETSSSLNLGSGNLYSMSSDIDYSTFPMRAAAKVATPYTDFRNIELTLTHDGELTNFVTTGLFTSPLTNDVNAKASLKYESVFDMEAAASLQSSMSGYDDLRAEAKMSTAADEKKAHLLMGWTNGQEIIVDGACRLQPSWYENKVSSDLAVYTPFPAVRSLAFQMETTEKEDSRSGKTTFELNDNSLLDIEGEYKTKDKPEIQISLRQPWSMLYTASLARDSQISDADIFINWNRNEPDSNIRVQTTMTDKSNDYQTENNLDIKVTHASRQVGVVHKMNIDSTQTYSNGQIYWDSDDSSKVFYDLQINDNSRRRKQVVDGSFKLGLPSRTFGLTTSYSDNNLAKATDMTFSWDVDRDDSKQVGVKATMKRGDDIKGDITLSLPSLTKKIRVDGEMTMKNGRIILDTKTDFSYSRDSRKTLTLTSKLLDVSDYYSNYNYSLSLGVSHPYTNLDLQFDSHIGSSDELTTFGMKTNYLTAKRQIKTLALLTEINKIKKQMNIQVNSPSNRMEIAGEVVSTSPYKVRMINKINDIEIFRTDMTVDGNKKSFVLNAFKENGSVTISAKYPNSTAFQADITHHTFDQDHTDAVLGVRLNTSRVMHTRLHWRPEMMNELRSLFLDKALEGGVNAKIVVSEINEAISDEISAKYIAITDEVARELRPFITALNEELSVVAVRMSEMSTELRAMYGRNDFYLQNMGDEIIMIQKKLATLTKDYRINYQQLIQSMTQSLRDMRRYPIREQYAQMVKESAKWMTEQVAKSLTWVESVMEELDTTIQEYQSKVSKVKEQALDTVYNATYVDYLSNRIGQIQNSVNLKPYMPSFTMPKQYTNAIYEARMSVFDGVNDFLEGSQAKYVKEGVNEVYQQGLWAYKYWQMEDNIRKHYHSSIQALKDIIEDELKEYSEEFQYFVKNPITVWDPEHGEIQADVPLPIVVKRLDQVPDVSPLVKKAEEMAALYLPDRTTLNKFVKTVSDTWPVQDKSQTMDNKLPKDLKKERPAKKFRKKGHKYRVRLSGQ